MTTRLLTLALLMLAACSWQIRDTRAVPPLPSVVPHVLPVATETAEYGALPTITPSVEPTQ